MATVLEICQGLPKRQYAAGEAVLTEGGTDSIIYVLVDGSVEIVKGDVQVNTVSDPGAIFGEVSVLLGLPHMATVKTLTPAVFHVVDNPNAFMRNNPDIALAVAALLAKRLHIVTSYLVDLKQQFEHHADHLSLVDEVLEALVHHQEPHTEAGSDRYPDTTVE
jgi:CRP-like cAMP-binding protein